MRGIEPLQNLGEAETIEWLARQTVITSRDYSLGYGTCRPPSSSYTNMNRVPFSWSFQSAGSKLVLDGRQWHAPFALKVDVAQVVEP